MPHLFPEVAEVLSQVCIPSPDVGQLGSLLLTADFQQCDPFFQFRHVSPLRSGLRPILYRRIAQGMPRRNLE
jgi:hypothetical protein